jgi:hypothetical protein
MRRSAGLMYLMMVSWCDQIVEDLVIDGADGVVLVMLLLMMLLMVLS